MKIHIKSDGTRAGTSVTREDGSELGRVQSIDLHMSAREVHPVARVTFVGDVAVDVKAEIAETIITDPLSDSVRIKKLIREVFNEVFKTPLPFIRLAGTPESAAKLDDDAK